MNERNSRNLGKTVIFGTFLFVSLALILTLWLSAFMSSEPVSPSYVRATLAVPTPEGFEATVEAMPTREHAPGYVAGEGQGSHGGHDTEPTPSPTFDVADWAPEEGLSDDLADE